ncbi:DUF4974 domain-containing protein [Sphingobacterium psychroaquaticum]|uniref:FecR family protein n=1 Tax=Sphingobacterium psychroaquaticum TaxID=561061 RepID=UPI00106D6741|nr:FecR domain-containing protein [Sphingobacterium psychroaquaticum]QBQ41341.1 DUF4974 domain-containing protein [Sphingobacterium psychroaquaticum]
MSQDKLELLFEKYFTKTATPAERAAFFRLIAQDKDDQELGRLLEVYYAKFVGSTATADLFDSEGLFARVQEQTERAVAVVPSRSRKIKRWYWGAAAAIVAIASLFAVWRTVLLPAEGDSQIAQRIQPAGAAGYLTLSNGKRIALDSLSTGLVAIENGVTIEQDDEGGLRYQMNTGEGIAENNILETSNGQFIKVTLPDGSLVWLNSGSSLTYPSRFSNERRNVTLRGEAYFEVARNVNAPFTVSFSGQKVTVLGTKFNVKAYSATRASATLLEGKVRVENAEGQSAVLSPGQEAELTDLTLRVQSIEAEESIAWKQGYFSFNNKELQVIMEDIGRWYDLEIVYLNTAVKSVKLIGSISRHSDINVLLQRMALTKEVRFRLDGRKLYVQ